VADDDRRRTEDPFVVRETNDEFVRFESSLRPAADADGAVDLPHERWGLDSGFEHVQPDQTERFEASPASFGVVRADEEWTSTEVRRSRCPTGHR
jgi:hypothetical protein